MDELKTKNDMIKRFYFMNKISLIKHDFYFD